MRYGFVIPGGDVETMPALAAECEAAGWDGVFIPDCIFIDSEQDPESPSYDPWVLLAAMALRTSRVRLGTMITPISRRRPWKLARETVTLDHLSHGRMVLPVGLGALDDAGFGRVGEATDRKTRAELLDEGLTLLDGLWSGERFSFEGKHYTVRDLTFKPTPVQSPRIPVWVVAAWPRPKSMERALKWDGVLPSKMTDDGSFAEMTPDDVRDMCAYIQERRTSTTPMEIIIEGSTPGNDPMAAGAHVRPYAEAGVTWWNEAMWGDAGGPEAVRERIRQGPPRIE